MLAKNRASEKVVCNVNEHETWFIWKQSGSGITESAWICISKQKSPLMSILRPKMKFLRARLAKITTFSSISQQHSAETDF